MSLRDQNNKRSTRSNFSYNIHVDAWSVITVPVTGCAVKVNHKSQSTFMDPFRIFFSGYQFTSKCVLNISKINCFCLTCYHPFRLSLVINGLHRIWEQLKNSYVALSLWWIGKQTMRQRWFVFQKWWYGVWAWLHPCSAPGGHVDGASGLREKQSRWYLKLQCRDQKISQQ